MASYYSEGGIDYTYDSRGNLVPITPEPVYTPPTPVVPDAIASNSTFQSINSATGGQLAELYSDIKQGNTNYYIGQYNEPTITLGSTGREITMTPTSTPGVYLAGLNTGGGGYTVPVKVDSKGNVSIADTAVTNANNINYVSNPGGGGFFSGLAENLKMAAPYLAAGYLGTQVLPGLLSGAGAGGASGVSAESLAIANATSDPIAALNALEGWTTADLGYLAQIGLPATYIEQAAANNAVLAGQSPNYYDGNYTATAADTASFLTPEQLAQYGASAATIAALTGGAAGGGAAGAGAAGAAGSALTGSALAKLAGGLLAGGALTGGMGGGNVTMPTPSNRAGVSTGSADYSPEYYQQLQQYYNAYMPTQPKDVATPLQQWYETKFTPDANVTNKLFGV